MRKFGVHAVAGLVGVLFVVTGLPVAAQEAAPAPEAGRYVEYSASATDRNNWRGTVAGEVQFFSVFRQWKIFGDVTGRRGSFSYDHLYVRIKQNINNTTQDGRWYGICASSYGSTSSYSDIPCDKYLDYERSSGSGTSETNYFWIGDNDSGEYFSFPTRPGRGLRGLWVRVCHAVDGPDVCGGKVYAPNPYIPQ